jgi:hypothetical protein
MRDRTLDRLYRLLPGHIRASDADEGRPLQALMQILASELEVVEGDIDTLYDNWFIETCEDWVVPYIGDLVGARPLREFGDGALRAYVANTLSYRQAKGTLAVLEQLGRDVTGWPCIGVEFFRRLIQSQNVNHMRLDNQATMSLRNAGTLRGADLASLVNGPFEKAAHTVDVRSIQRGEGRYNIPNIGLFVWRIQSYALSYAFDGIGNVLGGTIPAISAIGPAFRLFDPAGRTIRLFNRARTESSISELGSEPTMPGPLRRRPVAADLDGLRAGTPGAGRYFNTRPVVRIRLGGVEVPLSKLHCCNLEDRPDGMGGITWKRPITAGHVLFDPELGRLSLHASDENKAVETNYAYGFAHDLGGGPYDRRESFAAWSEAFLAEDTQNPLWQIGVTRRTQEITNDPNKGGPVVATLKAAIVAWNAQATSTSRGIISIMDDGTYGEALDNAAGTIKIPAGAHLAIVAAGWSDEDLGGGARKRTPGNLSVQDRRPLIASNMQVKGTGTASEDAGTLILDGILIAGKINVLSGDLGMLEARHCSLGIGTSSLGQGIAVDAGANGDNLRLNMHLAHCITGLVDAGKAAGKLKLCDTIVGEDRVADGDPLTSPVVLLATSADLEIARSTLFGKTVGRTLEADDSIFIGPLNIARRQDGCVRFSYVPEASRTPRRYRCTPDLQIAQAKEAAQTAGSSFTAADEQAIRERIRPVFTSTFAEHYAFCQLTRRCPDEITMGAEGGCEMGVMNSLGNPMRAANIRDALDEYLPFGLSAGVFFVN